MKKILAVLLVLLMILTTMPLGTLASMAESVIGLTETEGVAEYVTEISDDTPAGLYDYELNENDEAIITQYNGDAWSVYVPETIDEYTVVGIGDCAFESKSAESIVLPSAIESIGSSAFENCSNLISINIPSDVTIINDYVFKNCLSLASIDIPDGVTEILDSAFEHCLSPQTPVLSLHNAQLICPH